MNKTDEIQIAARSAVFHQSAAREKLNDTTHLDVIENELLRIFQILKEMDNDQTCCYVEKVDESAYKHLICDNCGNEESYPQNFCPECGFKIKKEFVQNETL